jgi:hypothetical protein
MARGGYSNRLKSEIKRPQFLVMKLDEKQEINIDMWVSTELPEVDISGQ